MEFDKDKQYGAFIEIVPLGEFSIFNNICFAGDWSSSNLLIVEKKLISQARDFVPEQYWDEIKIITKFPEESNDPYVKHGTIGWKYSPLQKGSE